MQLLKELCEAHGIPGREEAVRELVVRELEPVSDEIQVDALGNVIALKKGSGRGPKVMIAAHMDEIGFLVSYVDGRTGFLRIDPVGGFDTRVLMAQRVVVHADGGDFVGIIGTKPVHILSEEERKKNLEIKDLFVDLGLPASDVKKRVRVGDYVTLQQDSAQVGKLFSCKALDDRVGVYVMIEAVKKVKKHTADIYAVATTQEEVGVRGARVSSFNVAPDIGIALDVTVASDVPGAGEHEHVTKLGAGTAIKVKDSMSISHPKLVRKMREIAEKKKIKHQMEILPRGGTDAAAIQMTREGVASITISIPTRYLHSVVEAAHIDDIQASINLLASFLEVAHTVDYQL
ncbi:M42 family metallopeptidase [Candidatus Acetothermia bacterium]|nr:M42 family metallopeptidase [Candidatus Acetothermia bacterium]MBI3459412.1 M42 family metallopeptidase [Candidatus Acetothermia bacterium]MBI3659510.1 M42 family metallopeptidase [Candidatus Acetothermia bacterium]